MHCLPCRRWLLAAPRHRTVEQSAHLATCAECSRLAHQLKTLECDLEEAVLVGVPDALPARVLLGPRARGNWRYAAAAAFAGVSAVLGLVASGVVEAPGVPRTVQAVGPAHPAVVAIAEVANEDTDASAQTRPEERAELEDSLRRLGLRFKAGEATAYYVGKCHIDTYRECEHIVLSTADGYANVMLVPDYPLHERVLVTDRQLVALVSPVRDGGYIVVADSAKTAKRMEKLIVKG
jgi:hypothetical protein